MEFSDFVTKLEEKCPSIIRRPWMPENIATLTESEDREDRKCTKFGGIHPFRHRRFDRWPKCEVCSEQKHFVCQIDLSQLPLELRDELGLGCGLFQCFFCFNCEPYESDGCFSDIYFLPPEDLVPSLQQLAAQSIRDNLLDTKKLPDKLRQFVREVTEGYRLQAMEFDMVRQGRRVGSWGKSKIRELPDIGELEEHPEVMEATGLDRFDLWDFEGEMETHEDGVGFPKKGVKMGGWFTLGSLIAYPTCPDCKLLMTRPFLQLEDDELFPLSDCSSGTGHIDLCPACSRPGLGWNSS